MILDERLFESINIENKQKLDQLISKAYNNEISLETFYNELQNFDSDEKDKALADFVIYKKKIHSSKTNESLEEDIAEPTQETTSTESQKESGLTAVVNSLINDENEAIDGPKPGPQSALATIINDLIIDEVEATQGYNDAIVNAEIESFHDLAQIFRDIAAEEQQHIGMLQKALETISPNVLNIKAGEEEATEILGNQ